MNKMIPVLLATGLLAAGQSALALPQMDITSAKATLTGRSNTATGVEFNRRRVRDQPSFDRLGIGNYYAEYKLDAGQKVGVWMYVESAPPIVDEVVTYIYPAKPKDLTFDRALKLLNIIYGESKTGARVVADFREAKGLVMLNQYKKPTLRYQQGSLLPQGYDGALYYLGQNFGYKVSLHKGGLEVGIYRKDYWQKFIMEVKNLRYPDPKPLPPPGPTPTPEPTPRPHIVW
ncbi:MAG: hypothetical protein ACAI44_25695 [Candidatus Sericytochromatia bacterium]